MAWKILLCILLGYLVGGINPAYIIGTLRGFDIRKKGSGNAGASNAIITMGKRVGVISALLDIFKATAVMLIAPLFLKVPFAAEIAGVSCIIGHVFPAFMKFRGGKGLACMGGMLLAIDWRLFFVMFTAEVILLLLVDYICFVPITAAILIPIIYGAFGSAGAGTLINANGGWWGAAIIAAGTLVVFGKHIENLKRIHHGVELHFSFLWSKNKEAEIERVRKNHESRIGK